MGVVANKGRGAGGATRRHSEPHPTRARDPRYGQGDRYTTRGAIDPGAVTRSTRGVSLAIVAVEDPLPDPTRPPLSQPPRVLAAANRRVDILEWEISHGRIKPSEYNVGRIAQAIFERMSSARLGSGGFSPGDKVDQATAHELAVIYKVDDARTVVAWCKRIERAIGPIDARLLRQILGDRLSFSDVAASRGRAGEKGTRYYAERFRDALEELDGALAARGRQVMDDAGAPQIRAHRADGDEETDAAGVVVPAGRGFRIVDEAEGAGRWVPMGKRKAMERAATIAEST